MINWFLPLFGLLHPTLPGTVSVLASPPVLKCRTGCSTMDGGDGTADLVINKRFVSEAELEERRKRRQEEWEKVRKPEDPKECPEEAYDPRSLYERLQEQREKKQQEFEEQFKFKNMVRGLDEDETNFLDEVSRQQELLEKQRREEELKELNEYRISLTKVGVSMDPKKETEKKLPMKSVENKNKFSQAKLLAGAVKHRRKTILCSPGEQLHGRLHGPLSLGSRVHWDPARPGRLLGKQRFRVQLG
ncbi:PSME3-interacting protein isoform X3 [Patagioenas fasciata]|uniref:PSME3-interacting protein isoform X3 n=1 Tax=Patagioenas fasciata TaxID=372321 RepID=UPI003A9A0AAE